MEEGKDRSLFLYLLVKEMVVGSDFWLKTGHLITRLSRHLNYHRIELASINRRC